MLNHLFGQLIKKDFLRKEAEFKIRNEVKIICDSIKCNPLDWFQGTHTFYNEHTGISIWTSNGLDFIELYSSGAGTSCSSFNNWTIKEKKAILKAMENHQDAIIKHFERDLLKSSK